MNTTSHSAPLRRSSRQIIGGVCGGLAERLGVSPVLVRAGALVAAMLSSGLVVVAYLVAWVLMPPAGAESAAEHRPESEPATPVAPQPPSPVDAREAWYAVGDQLQALVGELRRPARDLGAVPDRPRTPMAAADRAATEVGDRLRRPEVRAASRRVVDGLNAAVSGGVGEALRRRDG